MLQLPVPPAMIVEADGFPLITKAPRTDRRNRRAPSMGVENIDLTNASNHKFTFAANRLV